VADAASFGSIELLILPTLAASATFRVSMKELLELVGLVLETSVTALAVAVLLLKYLPPATARYAFTAATAVGFLVGSLTFPDRMPLVPERHWHWLPYLGLLAVWLGSVPERLPWWLRWLGYACLAAIAGGQLVPGYADLKPAWYVLTPLLAVYLFAIICLLSLLPERLRGRLFIGLLACTAAATSVLVTSEISLRVGLFSLRIPVAIATCFIVSWLFHFPAEVKLQSAVLALIPVAVVLVGGTAFVGAIALKEPRWVLLLAPLAPLMLWLFAWGPLARLQGVSAVVAQIAAVASVPLAIFLWIFLTAEPDEWG
jgi:hypothetical protein